MKKLRIQTVCGFGCGSSLFLRMNIEEVLKENNLQAEVFCGDVGTCLSQPCDVIFVSQELMGRLADRADVPLVPIENLMDEEELTTKILDFMSQFGRDKKE